MIGVYGPLPLSICGLPFDFLHIGCWGVVASRRPWIAGGECGNALNVHMVLGLAQELLRLRRRPTTGSERMSGFQRLNIVRKTGFGAGLATLAMIAVSFSGGPLVAASCRTDAMAGIDWRECNKRLLMLGDSNLDSAMLYGTDFTYTDLRGSSLKGANLEKAKLIRTALGGANLQGANLTKVEAYRSDFSAADATNAKFINAEMQRTKFEKAKLDGTDFTKAELGRADFEGASLNGSKFSLTNLSRARFGGAKLGGPVDFTSAFLLLTRIEGVDLSMATGLDQKQIDIACGDAKTKLPNGLTAPASWPCPEEPDDDD